MSTFYNIEWLMKKAFLILNKYRMDKIKKIKNSRCPLFRDTDIIHLRSFYRNNMFTIYEVRHNVLRPIFEGVVNFGANFSRDHRRLPCPYRF